jgi:hypothetical protein
VSFPQVHGESPCRLVSSGVGSFGGHRAPMEHRDGGPVLDRTVEAGEWCRCLSSGLSVRWFD